MTGQGLRLWWWQSLVSEICEEMIIDARRLAALDNNYNELHLRHL